MPGFNFVAIFSLRLRDFIMQVSGVDAKEAHNMLDGVFSVSYDGRDEDVATLRRKLKRGPRQEAQRYAASLQRVSKIR